jgi:rod shape-determining protein MreC
MAERGDGGVRPEAVLAVLLIISILMILFTGTIRMQPERRFINRMILSAQRVAGKTTESVKDGFGSLRRLKELRVQYELALSKLNDYQGLEREVIELRRENQDLKTLLGLSSTLEYDHIPARIIAGDPSNLFDTMTIDKGTENDIRIGMVVTAFQDGFFGLLGKIVAVGTTSSQVRPVIDPENYVAARLERERFEGLVEGRGNDEGELIMRYVRKSAGELIAVNDVVVTSGMQSLYPSGLYLGRVTEVRSQEYSTSLELILKPVIDVTKTEYVFILKEAD